MNMFKTSQSAIKTLLTSLFTVSVFGGSAVIADQVGPSSLTKKVSFDDLDLSTIQGQHIAQERVHQMAKTLCDRVANPTDMAHHDSYLACVDVTMAKAGVSLQALINKQSTAQFARTDVK